MRYIQAVAGRVAVIETPAEWSFAGAAGQTYELTFDLSRFAGLPGAVSATVSDGVDSQSMGFSVSSNAWSGENWSFTAEDTGAYTLTLAAAGADTYPAVDDVALGEYSAVPEPAMYGVVLGSVAVAGAVFRTRSSRQIDRLNGES